MEDNLVTKLFNELSLLRNEVKNEIRKHTEKDSYESIEVKNISAALSKAQGEYPVIGFNRENPYFKARYTDLDTIFKSIRPMLSKNGLSFTQQIQISGDGITMLHTKLRHATGEWIESRSRIVPIKNDPQTFGSTLSYQKRYAAMALLGVTCSADATDDDGEIAMVDSRDMVAKGPSIKYNPKENYSETITKEQLEEMHYELEQYSDIAEMILDKMQIQNLADLPKSQYAISMKRIREIKALRNGVK